jgi:SAM-dependent methyltransferase
MDSTRYWIERYSKGGTSGAGSTGRLNIFKSGLLNAIIQKYGIESLLDLGCGQGAILESIEVSRYLGFDPSSSVIDLLREKYISDPSKEFTSDFNAIKRKELVISFDVIYHLIEDSVYEDYMKSLFLSSTRFVLIYSSNTDRTDSEYATAPHVKHRIFQERIPSDFFLLEKYKNIFPYTSNDPERTSWSDFYLYVKKQ